MNKLSQFIKRVSNTGSAHFKKQSSPATPLAKWCQNIEDLPLARYVDALVDDNLAALIICGKPTDEQLAQAWQDIKIQYADVMGDAEGKRLVIIMRELAILNVTLSQIDAILQMLESYYCDALARELNRLIGGALKFDPAAEAQYEATLKRARNRSKGIVLARDLKQSQLDALQKTYEDKQGKPSRRYFQDILISLSDVSSYGLTMDSMSTYEFCERIHRLNKRNEHAKMKK
jgi:hypothetical protein